MAVLGILAINIAGFAGPPGAVTSPHVPDQGSFADELAFAVKFVLFEGKMRALFSILFGAGIVLFIERTDAAGGFGQGRQLQRLGWLALFGLAHFYLLWWGDILFLYALGGVIVLFLLDLRERTLWIAALGVFAVWHAIGAAMDLGAIRAEQLVRAGEASAAQVQWYGPGLRAILEYAEHELDLASGGFLTLAAHRIAVDTLRPLEVALGSIGETVPLMLTGALLQRRGFFAGALPPRAMRLIAAVGLGCGLVLTLALLDWAWRAGFPPLAMQSIALNWSALPHLLMAVGYLAALVLLAPRLLATWPGRALASAGRMAFSNYIATSLLMTGLFYGWGFGLIGTAGHAAQWLFVAIGWLFMLGWSGPYLSLFRRGPLEWAWRSLTEGKILPNRR